MVAKTYPRKSGNPRYGGRRIYVPNVCQNSFQFRSGIRLLDELATNVTCAHDIESTLSVRIYIPTNVYHQLRIDRFSPDGKPHGLYLKDGSSLKRRVHQCSVWPWS